MPVREPQCARRNRTYRVLLYIDKHHVSFKTACRVFLDPDYSETRTVFRYDDGRREPRHLTIGKFDGTYWAVVFKPVNGRKRIISARRAISVERRYYDKAFDRRSV